MLRCEVVLQGSLDFAAGFWEAIEKESNKLPPPKLQTPIKQLCLHLEWQKLLWNPQSIAVIARSYVEMWDLGVVMDDSEMAHLLPFLWLEWFLSELFSIHWLWL